MEGLGPFLYSAGMRMLAQCAQHSDEIYASVASKGGKNDKAVWLHYSGSLHCPHGMPPPALIYNVQANFVNKKSNLGGLNLVCRPQFIDSPSLVY